MPTDLMERVPALGCGRSVLSGSLGEPPGDQGDEREEHVFNDLSCTLIPGEGSSSLDIGRTA
jgi:hypothetical protein